MAAKKLTATGTCCLVLRCSTTYALDTAGRKQSARTILLLQTVTRSAASPVNSTFMRRAAASSGQISLLIKSTTFSLIPFRRQLVWKPRCTLARGCRFRFCEPLSSSKVASSRCMSQAYSAQASGSDNIAASVQQLGARYCPDAAQAEDSSSCPFAGHPALSMMLGLKHL